MAVLVESRPPVIDTHIDADTQDDQNIPILPPLSASGDCVLQEAKAKLGEIKSGAPQTENQTTPLELVDRYIDEPRPLKVAVIGGGLAGILAGVLLPVKVPGIQLTIYEKNKDFVSWLNYAFSCPLAHQLYREGRGWKTDILVSAAIYHLMFISRLLSQKKIGPMSLHPDMKFAITGSLLLKSTTCTSMPNLSTW